jgi:hypothetical protein
MRNPDLSRIYLTADRIDGAAELRCEVHLDWSADVDGAAVPTAVARATGHAREAHADEAVAESGSEPGA